MKKLFSLLLLIITFNAYAQKQTPPTESFTVTGKIKQELTITFADIAKLTPQPIADVTITNHSGESRGTAKQLKGVLVKELLKNLELNESNPKLFSEFYLVFVGIDGYKVVYSWNEVFNSAVGDNVFLITSRDGNDFKNMKERLLILTPTDFKTGRRHIKSLDKIRIERAE